MIKIITGFRDDQYYSIDENEAHKAYYLFLNPEKRGVFSNGVALVGKNIQGIEPDWNATMGWNASHKLDSDDWNEIRNKGVDKSLKSVLEAAKIVAMQIEENPNVMNLKLEEALEIISEPDDTKNLNRLEEIKNGIIKKI